MHKFSTRNGLRAPRIIEILQWLREEFGDGIVRITPKGVDEPRNGVFPLRYEMDVFNYGCYGNDGMRPLVMAVQRDADLAGILGKWGNALVDGGPLDVDGLRITDFQIEHLRERHHEVLADVSSDGIEARYREFIRQGGEPGSLKEFLGDGHEASPSSP